MSDPRQDPHYAELAKQDPAKAEAYAIRVESDAKKAHKFMDKEYLGVGSIDLVKKVMNIKLAENALKHGKIRLPRHLKRYQSLAPELKQFYRELQQFVLTLQRNNDLGQDYSLEHFAAEWEAMSAFNQRVNGFLQHIDDLDKLKSQTTQAKLPGQSELPEAKKLKRQLKKQRKQYHEAVHIFQKAFGASPIGAMKHEKVQEYVAQIRQMAKQEKEQQQDMTGATSLSDTRTTGATRSEAPNSLKTSPTTPAPKNSTKPGIA